MKMRMKLEVKRRPRRYTRRLAGWRGSFSGVQLGGGGGGTAYMLGRSER